VKRVSGAYILILGDRLFFLADTTVNIDPTPAEAGPRSPSSPSSSTAASRRAAGRHALLLELRFEHPPLGDQGGRATEIVREKDPALEIDGEMQADTAGPLVDLDRELSLGAG